MTQSAFASCIKHRNSRYSELILSTRSYRLQSVILLTESQSVTTTYKMIVRSSDYAYDKRPRLAVSRLFGTPMSQYAIHSFCHVHFRLLRCHLSYLSYEAAIASFHLQLCPLISRTLFPTAALAQKSMLADLPCVLYDGLHTLMMQKYTYKVYVRYLQAADVNNRFLDGFRVGITARELWWEAAICRGFLIFQIKYLGNQTLN